MVKTDTHLLLIKDRYYGCMQKEVIQIGGDAKYDILQKPYHRIWYDFHSPKRVKSFELFLKLPYCFKMISVCSLPQDLHTI